MSAVGIIALIQQVAREARGEEWLQFATIDPAYISGLPKLTFDGETELSEITYSHLESYAPAPSDRVVVARVGSSKVILGGIV